MNKQIYTITELAKELNQARQNVRRRLLKLSIIAVNEYTREHKTDPLLYDFETLKILSEDFGLVQRTSDSTTKEQASSSNEQAKEQAKNDIFMVLKEQLEHEREQNKKLSKLNENLLNQLDKNQTLLDQQQRLSLQANQKNQILGKTEEIKEKSESYGKKKWWNFLNKKNQRVT